MVRPPTEDFELKFVSRSQMPAGSARRGATLILGAPRSGTTWLHNILIQIGRFRGVLGNDLVGSNSRSIFLTDENEYLHRLLTLANCKSASRPLAMRAVRLLALTIRLRYGREGEYLLKSPYYCHFLGDLLQAHLGDNYIFLRRSLDAIALSMIRHPHLSKLVTGPYSGFFEIVTESANLETRHVAPALVRFFQDNYGILTPYDRAIFKAHCFSSAFYGTQRLLTSDNRCFIFDYDEFHSSGEQRRAFAEFLHLSPDQSQILNNAFASPKISCALPDHSAVFRSMMLHAEATIWLAQERLGSPQRPRLSPGWLSSAAYTIRQTP